MCIRKGLIIIFIIIGFCMPASIRAAGLRVWPAELKVQAGQGMLKRAELVVENPNANAALYEVYLDNFSDWIKIKPESFILESGESQKVLLELKAKELGIFSGLVSVLAKPFSEREFQTGAGVKIPLAITVVQGPERVFLANLTQAIGHFFGTGLLFWTVLLVLAALMGKNLLKNRQAKCGDYYDSPMFNLKKHD